MQWWNARRAQPVHVLAQLQQLARASCLLLARRLVRAGHGAGRGAVASASIATCGCIAACFAAADLVVAHEGVAELHRVERWHLGAHLRGVAAVARPEAREC